MSALTIRASFRVVNSSVETWKPEDGYAVEVAETVARGDGDRLSVELHADQLKGQLGRAADAAGRFRFHDVRP